MGKGRLDAKAFGVMAALLVLSGAVLLWIRRRGRWTNHDVSDPGVTL
jgi:nitrate reductase gamma subunit